MPRNTFVLVLFSTLFVLSGTSGCATAPSPTRSPLSPISTHVSTSAAGTPPPKAIATSAISDWMTDTPDPAETPLIISSVKRSEDGTEIIFVTNVGETERPLKNRSILDPQTMEYIDLPEDVVLAPGESFKVYNGAVTRGKVDGLVWREEPLLQSRGDQLVLVNQAGRVLWNYVNSRDYP